MNLLLTRLAPILAPIVVLFVAGLAVLWSAADHMGEPEFVSQQLKWVPLALGGGAAAWLIPYRILVKRAWLLYGLAIVLLVAVKLVGVRLNGSQRWLSFGGFSLQPSEVAKVAYVLAMAKLLQYRRDIDSMKSLLLPGIVTALPFGLIFSQPDLGSSLLFVPVAFAMLFVSGTLARHIASIVIVGAIVAVLCHAFVLEPYQKERILSTVFRDRLTPAERQREGYQLEQALRSVGIGGWVGEGYRNGTQNRLDKLPFRHNDFIFAVAAEEFGFFGASALVAAMAALLYACFRVASTTRDPAGRLVVVGVAVFYGFQSLVHVGVNLGVVPTKGMTLPYFSHGGTALLTTFTLFGLVLNVASRQIPVVAGDAHREQLARLRAVPR